MTLGGTLIVRNSIRFDYCLEAALLSLFPICDEVVVVDGYSDDGTWEMLRGMARQESKLRLQQERWVPNGGGEWLSELTNRAIAMLTTEANLNLQADEVVCEWSYPLVLELAATGGIYTLERLNFWHDHRHLLPPDEKVGTHVVRLAPVDVQSVGDAQSLATNFGWQRSRVQLMHYGFLRKGPAFVAKSREMMAAWGWGLDPVLEEVERRGMEALVDPVNATSVPVQRLVPYMGPHPRVAHRWLQERGYKV